MNQEVIFGVRSLSAVGSTTLVNYVHRSLEVASDRRS